MDGVPRFEWHPQFITPVPILTLILSCACAANQPLPPQIPDNPLVKISQAADYLLQGQCDRAVGLYNEVLPKIAKEKGIAPNQVAELYYYQGLAYACLKQYADALNSFQRALAVEPLYHPAKNGMAMVYTELDRYADAERIYLDLLKVPDYPQSAVYFNLAKLYIKQGEWTRSVFVARKAVELAPDELGPRLLFAQILEKLGLKQDALAQYRVIVKRWPNNLESLHHLARLYEESGQHCEAKKQYWRILELDPVGPYAEESTMKIQTLPCRAPMQTVPPPAPKKPVQTEKTDGGNRG